MKEASIDFIVVQREFEQDMVAFQLLCSNKDGIDIKIVVTCEEDTEKTHKGF